MRDDESEKNLDPPSESGNGKEDSAASAQAPVVDETAPESIKEALAAEKERAERNLANWQRAQADLINYRKRMEQEKEELATFANATLIASLLSILDDFERAQNSMPSSITGITWVEGVFMMHKKLLAILESHGLSKVEALGQDFDPNLHEAVLYGEGDDGKVVEELQKGYKLRDRVLRPAMVQVGKGDRQEEAKEEEAPGQDQGDS
ncbi:MAG: nucleotide exchange factor GrpE [Chloroflexi bacterium]|nr:nucleotide exchange factor GrpE [Chloroflexota bacterium]